MKSESETVNFDVSDVYKNQINESIMENYLVNDLEICHQLSGIPFSSNTSPTLSQISNHQNCLTMISNLSSMTYQDRLKISSRISTSVARRLIQN